MEVKFEEQIKLTEESTMEITDLLKGLGKALKGTTSMDFPISKRGGKSKSKMNKLQGRCEICFGKQLSIKLQACAKCAIPICINCIYKCKECKKETCPRCYEVCTVCRVWKMCPCREIPYSHQESNKCEICGGYICKKCSERSRCKDCPHIICHICGESCKNCGSPLCPHSPCTENARKVCMNCSCRLCKGCSQSNLLECEGGRGRGSVCGRCMGVCGVCKGGIFPLESGERAACAVCQGVLCSTCQLQAMYACANCGLAVCPFCVYQGEGGGEGEGECEGKTQGSKSQGETQGSHPHPPPEGSHPQTAAIIKTRDNNNSSLAESQLLRSIELHKPLFQTQPIPSREEAENTEVEEKKEIRGGERHPPPEYLCKRCNNILRETGRILEGPYMHTLHVDTGSILFLSPSLRLSSLLPLPHITGYDFPPSSISIAHSIYLTGGESSTHQKLTDLYRLNVYNGQTSIFSLAPMILARYWHGVVHVANGAFIYVIGGYTRRQCERYDVEKDEWMEIAKLAHISASPAVCVCHDRFIYKFGGSPPNSDIELYDTQLQGLWELISLIEGNYLPRIYGAGCTELENSQILVYGGNEGGKVYLFDTKERTLVGKNDMMGAAYFNYSCNSIIVDNKLFATSSFHRHLHVCNLETMTWSYYIQPTHYLLLK